MKTAIYVENGVVQLVLTPETDFEKSCFKLVSGAPKQAKIFEGSFYDCRGGWTRQSDYHPPYEYGYSDLTRRAGEESLIIRVDDAPTPSVEQTSSV